MILINLMPKEEAPVLDRWPGPGAVGKCPHKHLGVLQRNVDGKCALCAAARTAKFREINPEYNIAWREANPGYDSNWAKANKTTRTLNRRRWMGVTNPEIYDALFAFQGGACAICGTTDFGKTGPCLDHYHGEDKKGPSRGVLCRNCNSGIGQLRDSEELLEAALNYLRNPPAARLLDCKGA